MLRPRDKGLAFSIQFNQVYTLSADETIEINNVSVTGKKTTHGEGISRFELF